MLINVHTHITADQDVQEWFDKQKMQDADVTIVFGSSSSEDDSGKKCLEAVKAFPGRIIPFGILARDKVSPGLVEDYHSMGFKGLKMIATNLAYDDEAYYPVYEKAVEYKLPILFHTGHLVVRDFQRRGLINRNKMDAFRLDGIARAFPELDLIGAHLGNPRWEDACSIAFKHPKVYFDLSGGTAYMLPYSRWRMLLMTGARESLKSREEKLSLGIVNKLLFGTDGEEVPKFLEFYENLFDAFDFPEETRELILWRNAARILGIEEELENRQKS